MAHGRIESSGFVFCGSHGVCDLLFGGEHLNGLKGYANSNGASEFRSGYNFKQTLQPPVWDRHSYALQNHRGDL